MKFIYAEKTKENIPTFADVETNQFFVAMDGKLCQKASVSSYNIIANKNGTPYADYRSSFVYHCNKIKRILPKVVKINF